MNRDFDKSKERQPIRNSTELGDSGSGALDPNERSEVLESMLASTQQCFDDQGLFPLLVKHVQVERLRSAYSFENVTELVRFILSRTRLPDLPIDFEECVTWVANCLHDDPIANERTERLWSAIIQRIQDGP